MLQFDQIEELIGLISALDRVSVTRQLLEFEGDFPIDFTPEFLDSQSVEQLQHLLFALCVQCQQAPLQLAETARV